MRDETRGDAELVLAVRAGERDAFGTLVDRWFDRCWEVAWRILHDHGLAADVAQDALFTAWRQLDRLDQPGSFGGWVLRISRNRALDRLERERRTMSTGDDEVLETTAASATSAALPTTAASELGRPDDEVVRTGQKEMVWAAAAALGERDASLLDLHLRHGLEPGELAEELGITPNAAHQALFRLRNRLGDAIRAWLLWRGGEPTCVILQAEVAAAGLSVFDGRLVRHITSHAEACLACSEERARVTAPAALFGAVPLVLAPTLARAEALDALRTAGVPVPAVDGAAFVPPPTSSSSGSTLIGSTGEAPPADRGVSAWDRVRIPTVMVVLLLLLGGLVRWWPDVSEPLESLADAGIEEVEDVATQPVSPVDEDPPGWMLDPETSRLIDGSTSDVEPAQLPHADSPGGATEGWDGRAPTQLTPADEPGGETPDGSRSPEEGGVLDQPSEEPAEEGGGGEEPIEEPVEPEEPDPDPPTITRFELTHLDQTCTIEGQLRPRIWRVAWETQDATSVELDLSDGLGPRPVDSTGMLRQVCLPLGATVELMATNDGGTVAASEQAVPE